MSTRTIKLFDPQAAPTVAAALYTVPANARARITKLTAAVTGTTPRLLTGYLVPSGDSAAAANTVEPGLAIAGEDAVTVSAMIGHVLEAGDTLQIIVDAGTDCTIHATGTEETI